MLPRKCDRDVHNSTCCREGVNSYLRARRKRGGPAIDRLKATEKAWAKANPDKMKYYARTWQRRKVYGFDITRQQELAVYEASDGLCAICYDEPATHIDHDHDTGVIRGALCRKCNQGLGLLRDDPEVLRSALDYLTTPLLIEA